MKDSRHLFFLAFLNLHPKTHSVDSDFCTTRIQIFISDAAQLPAKMKRRPLPIITARGGLVSEAALIKVLWEGLIAAGSNLLNGESTRDGSGSIRNLGCDQITVKPVG